jgi:nucleotide-binding universal stress UspA family protein
MYRNIMVPVDGSSFSREAVFQGLRIASRCGATLRLVRVSPPTVLGVGPESFTLTDEGDRQLRAAELADLYCIAAECRAHSTVNVTASLQRGPVLDSLISYAHRTRVDLIVMRSHARKGLARVWFGSIADGLIRKSGIPVLVVRPPSVAAATEGVFGFRRILVPLDGSALAEESLAAAAQFARIDGSQLILLRVVAPASIHGGHTLWASQGPARAEDAAEAQRYLASLLTSPVDRVLNVRRRVIISDDVPGAILQAAEGEEVDMIAIATRGRGAIARATNGSVADRIMREAQISSTVLHPSVMIAPEAQLRPSQPGVLL